MPSKENAETAFTLQKPVMNAYQPDQRRRETEGTGRNLCTTYKTIRQYMGRSKLTLKRLQKFHFSLEVSLFRTLLAICVSFICPSVRSQIQL